MYLLQPVEIFGEYIIRRDHATPMETKAGGALDVRAHKLANEQAPDRGVDGIEQPASELVTAARHPHDVPDQGSVLPERDEADQAIADRPPESRGDQDEIPAPVLDGHVHL